MVTLWKSSDNFEVIVIVNKTSCWWNLMIAIAVLAEYIYWLYLPSLLYLGWSFCLSCSECPSVRIAIKSLKNSSWKPEVKHSPEALSGLSCKISGYTSA